MNTQNKIATGYQPKLYRSSFLQESITLSAVKIGDDFLLTIYGGHSPHIGACSLSYPYIGGGNIDSASVSVIERDGHRDGELATDIARKFSRTTGFICCVVCGIHYDNLNRHQLEKLIQACEALLNRLLRDVMR